MFPPSYCSLLQWSPDNGGSAPGRAGHTRMESNSPRSNWQLYLIIIVIEEAQSVLIRKSPASVLHINRVREGRKYDSGCLLVTQQRGSIPQEIFSRGDNRFVLHLLSKRDLFNLEEPMPPLARICNIDSQKENPPGRAAYNVKLDNSYTSIIIYLSARIVI